jgi:hypothetical protein
MNAIRKTRHTLLDAITEVGTEINSEKAEYIFISHRQNAGQIIR